MAVTTVVVTLCVKTEQQANTIVKKQTTYKLTGKTQHESKSSDNIHLLHKGLLVSMNVRNTCKALCCTSFFVVGFKCYGSVQRVGCVVRIVAVQEMVIVNSSTSGFLANLQ
jgi:hypothetical protein